MRAIIAARLSKLQRNGQQGIGIDTQDERSREFADREGIEVVEVIPDTKSGVVAPWDRKKLRPWVTDPDKMALYDCIIAYKNDRLSRGCWADEARIRLWAEDHDKRLIIVDGPQWPPRHPGDKWAWEAQADQAWKEWEAGRERSMRAQAALRERGKLVGRPPFGYVSAGEKYDHTIIPTDSGRRLIPEVFERCARGDSLAQIALWLKTETGRDWHAKSVGVMIRCTTYMGRRQDATGRTILRCEALVPAELWQRANDSLTARPGPGKGGRPVTEKAMLTGVLRCPACDGPMYPIMMGGYNPVKVTNLLTGRRERRFNVVRGNGADWVKSEAGGTLYYRCAGKQAVRRSTCKNNVPLAAADALVTRFMATLRRRIMRTEYIPGHDHLAELAEIEQDMAALRRSDPDYRARYAELDARYERVSGLPSVPPEIRPVDTGETYASRWAALSPAARGDWLRASGIRVYASRILPGGESPQDGLRKLGEGTLRRADTIQDDGIRVIVAWNMEALRAA